MTVVLPQSTSREPLSATPVVDVVIPVHNEEADLDASVRRLREYLTAHLPYTYRITIVDNASTDATAVVAGGLADELPEVASLHVDRKGRGHALRVAWLASASPVLAYMDVDLSTGLSAVLRWWRLSCPGTPTWLSAAGCPAARASSAGPGAS